MFLNKLVKLTIKNICYKFGELEKVLIQIDLILDDYC